MRLRRAGWRIWRLDAEMTLHDAAMTRFGQWWRRTARAGYAAAEGAAMHGAARLSATASTRPAAPCSGGWRCRSRRCSARSGRPWALLLLLAYPAQILRLSRREGWARATFLTLGKMPEAQGALSYAWRRLRGGPGRPHRVQVSWLQTFKTWLTKRRSLF